MRSGWFRESYRHGLAARGIKTNRYMATKPWQPTTAGSMTIDGKVPKDIFAKGVEEVDVPSKLINVQKGEGERRNGVLTNPRGYLGEDVPEVFKEGVLERPADVDAMSKSKKIILGEPDPSRIRAVVDDEGRPVVDVVSKDLARKFELEQAPYMDPEKPLFPKGKGDEAAEVYYKTASGKMTAQKERLEEEAGIKQDLKDKAREESIATIKENIRGVFSKDGDEEKVKELFDALATIEKIDYPQHFIKKEDQDIARRLRVKMEHNVPLSEEEERRIDEFHKIVDLGKRDYDVEKMKRGEMFDYSKSGKPEIMVVSEKDAAKNAIKMAFAERLKEQKYAEDRDDREIEIKRGAEFDTPTKRKGLKVQQEYPVLSEVVTGWSPKEYTVDTGIIQEKSNLPDTNFPFSTRKAIRTDFWAEQERARRISKALDEL